jgi:hypothetical protein
MLSQIINHRNSENGEKKGDPGNRGLALVVPKAAILFVERPFVEDVHCQSLLAHFLSRRREKKGINNSFEGHSQAVQLTCGIQMKKKPRDDCITTVS